MEEFLPNIRIQFIILNKFMFMKILSNLNFQNVNLKQISIYKKNTQQKLHFVDK